MPTTIQRPATQPRATRRVSPSVVDPATAEPFTLEQELKPFGAWVGDPIWVPPKDASETLAETMLRESRPFASKEKRWASVVKKHRTDFTQVREFDLFQASIRLPQGKFFVTVTEQKDFDKITDPIPNCVQTRLEEFLSGPDMKRGAKVYYLKPLCIEMGDELILTTREDLTAAITKIQEEVFRGVSSPGTLPPAAASHGGCRQPWIGHSSRGGELCCRAQTKGNRCVPCPTGIQAKKARLRCRQNLSQVSHGRLHVRRDA